MARWEPNARGRLQESAMTLFFERGYDDVTVEDIAKKAGLTKRSFFNHFADKREVVFAAADGFEEAVLAALARADAGLDPLEAATWAYTQASASLEDVPEFAKSRLALINSSPELQERDLVKMAATIQKVAVALEARGTSRREATLVSQAAATAFTIGVEEWICDPDRGLAQSIQDALANLRRAVGSGTHAAENEAGPG